uniref:Uncharacterized protein n=1 Tax=Trichobilharzia regenti TaxID=157069 RepID=A0AA85IXU1_TRIRE|nr:unnamed protein product [Trichobilharzia regenti]
MFRIVKTHKYAKIYEVLSNRVHLRRYFLSSHRKMQICDAICAKPTFKSQGQHKVTARYYIWFLGELLVMLLVTAGFIVLFELKNEISKFFKDKYYIVFIILSVSVILILILLFVRKVQSKYIAVLIILGSVTQLFCILAVVYSALFILIIMFICLNMRSWIIWCMRSDNPENHKNSKSAEFFDDSTVEYNTRTIKDLNLSMRLRNNSQRMLSYTDY